MKGTEYFVLLQPKRIMLYLIMMNLLVPQNI